MGVVQLVSILNSAMWSTYIKTYLISSLNDPTINIPDIVTTLQDFHTKCNLGDDEYMASVSGILDCPNSARALEFIKQAIEQQPQFKKMWFHPKTILLSRTNPGLQPVLDCITEYEQEYGEDVTSITYRVNALIKDGYDKHKDLIDQEMAKLKPLVEGE